MVIISGARAFVVPCLAFHYLLLTQSQVNANKHGSESDINDINSSAYDDGNDDSKTVDCENAKELVFKHGTVTKIGAFLVFSCDQGFKMHGKSVGKILLLKFFLDKYDLL